jgi:hypothetical protein
LSVKTRDLPSVRETVRAPGDQPTGAVADAPASGKWSGRRTLLFILTVCGGFWTAVIAAAFALAR